MWYASVFHAPFEIELSSPSTGVKERASPTLLNMNALKGLKPIQRLASPAAPLPVSPLEPRLNTAKPDWSLSTISPASTAIPDPTRQKQLVEPSGRYPRSDDRHIHSLIFGGCPKSGRLDFSLTFGILETPKLCGFYSRTGWSSALGIVGISDSLPQARLFIPGITTFFFFPTVRFPASRLGAECR